MASSADDPKVAANILRHIAGEESYMARPYIDPNGVQANIGYGHMIYEYTQKEIEGSRGKTRAARDKYLLSLLPKHLSGLNWNKSTAQNEMWRNFQTHREIAKEWLTKYGMDDDERLADQLGMLFFGSRGKNFRNSVAVRKPLEEKDYAGLSRVASMFGRTNQGRYSPVLAARRKAEGEFYVGKALPEKDSPKDAPGFTPPLSQPQPRSTRASPVWDKYRRGEFFNIVDQSPSRQIPDSPEDWQATSEEIIGREGKRRANEVVWKVLGRPGPMPEDFDASVWARTFAPDKSNAYDNTPWEERMVKRGVASPTAGAGDVWQKFLISAEQGQKDFTKATSGQAPASPRDMLPTTSLKPLSANRALETTPPDSGQ